MTQDWSLVPKRIKDIRILHNFKQEDLGNSLGLSKQAISAIEKGKRKVDIKELLKISEFFNEPLEAFFAKEFKFDYYPKNIYGSFPKFAVDYLDDCKYFLKKLTTEYHDNSYDFNESKTFTLKIIKAMQEILDEFIEENEIELR